MKLKINKTNIKVKCRFINTIAFKVLSGTKTIKLDSLNKIILFPR